MTSMRKFKLSNTPDYHISFVFGTTEIKNNTCKRDFHVVGITLPQGVKSIGAYAFQNCLGIKKLDFPETVEVVGAYAFSCCDNLQELYLSSNLKRIEEGAFSNCVGLGTVYIPNSVEYLALNTFSPKTRFYFKDRLFMSTFELNKYITTIRRKNMEKKYDVMSLTKEQLVELIKNGNDTVDNQIRVNIDGEIYLSQEVGADNIEDLKFRFETFDAGGGCIGEKASKDEKWINRLYEAIEKNRETSSKTYIDQY